MFPNGSSWHSGRYALLRKLLGAALPIFVTLYLFASDVSVEAFAYMASAAGSVQPKRRDPLQEKIDRIVVNGSKSPVPPRSTVFTEDEVNQILRVQMKEALPNGLSDPQVRLIGNNILAARVVVDFDEYKRQRQGRGSLGPLALLGGKLPVNARGVLHSRDGQGQIKLDTADANGIPLPPALVREMTAALSRSAHNPQGYDIEQPFPLPASIRAVRINPKEAVVTQ
jgi:hypothetical protein